MPEHNPYGEALPGSRLYDPDVIVPVRVTDRGIDPRPVVAASLRILSTWHECDYRLIADEVELMHPDDKTCAFCGYDECETGCPMMRWRGQA